MSKRSAPEETMKMRRRVAPFFPTAERGRVNSLPTASRYNVMPSFYRTVADFERFCSPAGRVFFGPN
jgi:hypothetical protein